MAYFTSFSLIAGAVAVFNGASRFLARLCSKTKSKFINPANNFPANNFRRETSFWLDNKGIYVPVGVIALLCVRTSSSSEKCNIRSRHGVIIGIIEYASSRTGDPADEDAAAKQVQCTLVQPAVGAPQCVCQCVCQCVDGCIAQAVDQDDPSILEAATTRNNAMWPVFVIFNLNRLNS